MDNINNINKTRILSPFFSKGAPAAGFVNVYVGWMDMSEQSNILGLLTPLIDPKKINNINNINKTRVLSTFSKTLRRTTWTTLTKPAFGSHFVQNTHKTRELLMFWSLLLAGGL